MDYMYTNSTTSPSSILWLHMKRAEKRDLDSKNIEFIHADMEKIPLPDNSVDCVISNGAFCLAPNKRKSFEEIKRVLKEKESKMKEMSALAKKSGTSEDINNLAGEIETRARLRARVRSAWCDYFDRATSLNCENRSYVI